MKKEKTLGAKRLVWPLLAGLALVVLLASCGGPSGSAQTSTGNGEADLGHPSLGDKNAPVVMIEYGDFQ